MASIAELTAAGVKLISAADKYFAIVNGPATGVGSTVTVNAGTLDTLAKQSAALSASIAAFEAAGVAAIATYPGAVQVGSPDPEAGMKVLLNTGGGYELALWNSTRSIYQYVRIEGTAGNEQLTFTDV